MNTKILSASKLVAETLLIKNKDARIKQLVWLMESADNDADADYFYEEILYQTNGWGYELKHC
jgi:hypothetical protein